MDETQVAVTSVGDFLVDSFPVTFGLRGGLVADDGKWCQRPTRT